MAEPRVNRQTLRRQIARDLGMPFFKRFPNGIAVQDTATSGINSATDSTAVRDSRLTQGRDYWNNGWMYDVNSGEVRLIVDFREHEKALIPEYDFTTAPDTATTIEIFNIHTPDEIHLAINDGITNAFPSFFNVETYENIILEEDKLEYDFVSDTGGGVGLLTNPYRIKNMAIERTGSGQTFQPESATSTTIVNSTLDLSDIDSDWSVGVYAGKGAGQYAVVSSVDTATGTITVPAMTLTLDTTSKVRLWERAKELYSWDYITAVEFDAKDYPNKFRLLERYPDKVGLRFRIQYVQEPQALSSDTASTTVPAEYIKHAAIAKLLRSRARSKPGDADKYVGLAGQEQQDAERFKLDHAFDLPDQTLWTEEDFSSRRGDFFEIDNPLDW